MDLLLSSRDQELWNHSKVLTKNDIFRGSGPGSNSRDISDRLTSLKNDLADLRQQESEIDKHKQWVQQSIKNVTDEVTNIRSVFVWTITCLEAPLKH